MPQLRFHAFKPEKVQDLSLPLSTELAEITGIKREYFTFEVIHSTFVKDGEVSEGDPFVELYCFDRGADVFDKMAATITKHVNTVGIPEVDVAFILLERRRYYENGVHF